MTEETLPNEAGFSTNFYMNHLSFGRVQYTFRGATSKDWGAVLEDEDKFLKYMHERGWLLDGEARDAGMPVKTEAPDAPKKKYEQKPVPANEVPDDLPGASEGGAEYFKDEFDSFSVTPEEGDKATVKFMKDKMDYPVGGTINKWKNDHVRQALARLGDIDPSVPKTYRVAGVQYWTLGNEYTSKKDGSKRRYKDFRGAYQSL